MLTVERIDEVIEELNKLAELDDSLEDDLRNMKSWQRRHNYLERFVCLVCEDVGVEYSDMRKFLIKDRFIYEFQKKTGIDVGFCEYFEPRYREQIQEMLAPSDKDLLHRCSYNDEIMSTTCNGLSHEECAVLHPNLKRARELPLGEIVKLMRRKGKALYN